MTPHGWDLLEPRVGLFRCRRCGAMAFRHLGVHYRTKDRDVMSAKWESAMPEDCDLVVAADALEM